MAISIWWYEKRHCWAADVPTKEGRKRLYLGPNEKKAQAELHRHLASYYESLNPDEADSKPRIRGQSGCISLLELAVRFLKWNQINKSGGTWRTYRDGLKHVTKRHKTKLADELTPQDIEAVKAAMIKDDYAARTINIMVTSVKRLYNWASKQALIHENQLSGVEHVSKHVNAPEHPEDKHLSLERARACIEACHGSRPLGDMCEIMLLTGMRVGELVRVTWRDIDFEQRMLRLARHKTDAHSARPRTIPLCDRAVEIITSQADEDMDPDDPVFVGRDCQQLTVDGLHCRLQRLRKSNAVLAGFSFHKLRHTCATYLARQKVPERVAQAILGHSSTLMMRYYTATDKNEMLEAVEKLSAAAGGGGGIPKS